MIRALALLWWCLPIAACSTAEAHWTVRVPKVGMTVPLDWNTVHSPYSKHAHRERDGRVKA